MERADRIRLALGAGLAAGALVAALSALAFDPTNALFRDASVEWSFVHWLLLGRWTYALGVASWGFALGALAARRGGDATVIRWSRVVAIVALGGLAAALSLIPFWPKFPSAPQDAGGLLELGVDAVTVVLFAGLHVGLVTGGGALAVGVGRLARMFGDRLPPPWGVTGALAMCAAFVLLAGAASPASLGAPVDVLAALALAGVAAAGIRAQVPVVAVALLATACVPLFVARSQHAVAWERDRARRAAAPACWTPGEDAAHQAQQVHGVLAAAAVESSRASGGPRIAFLARADADPAAVTAAMREAFPPCTVGHAFDPTVVEPEIVPSAPTPLAFHYVVVDDGDAAGHAAALEPALREALVPRAGSKMLVQGNGAEPRFALPDAPAGVMLLRICSAKECRVDEMVDLEEGHHAAFGSLEVAPIEALDEPTPGADDVDFVRHRLPPGDGDRERSLRARWLGLAVFAPRAQGPDAGTCDELRRAVEPIPPAAMEARTLYWAGRGLGDCAGAARPGDGVAGVRASALDLLGRVPATSGIWALRAASARAALLPATNAPDLAMVKALLERGHAFEAADPLVRLDVLRGYACRAGDAALVAKLVADLRAAKATDRSWLEGVAATRADALATCAGGAAGVADAGGARP